MKAEGSTTGAGGMGTPSPLATGPALPPITPSQAGSAPQAGAAGAAQAGAAQAGAAQAGWAQPLWQPLSQQERLQLKRRSSKQGLQRFLQPQPLWQPLSGQQPRSAAQLGAQAALPQPLWQPSSQQPRSRQREPQHLRVPSMPRRFKPQQRFLQQPSLQPLSQQAGAAPQAGSAPQAGAAGAAHVGAAGAAHVGAAQLGAAGAAQAGAAQAGAAQAGLQQALAVSQQLVWQPQPLAPSIRSSRSKPKPCVHRLKPSTIDPKSMFHFI